MLIDLDVGHAMRAVLVAHNTGSDSAEAVTAPSAPVVGHVPVLRESPIVAVSGASPTVGIKIGAWRGTWTNQPTSYRVQYLRCDAVDPGTCTDLTAYRDSSTHRPVDADSGHTLKVTNATGDSHPAISNPTGVVP